MHPITTPATVTMVGTFPGKPINDDFDDTDGTNPVTIAVLANDIAPGGRQFNPQSVTVMSAPLHGQTLEQWTPLVLRFLLARLGGQARIDGAEHKGSKLVTSIGIVIKGILP